MSFVPSGLTLHPGAYYVNASGMTAPISGITTFVPALPTDPIEHDLTKTVYDDFIIISIYQDCVWNNTPISRICCFPGEMISEVWDNTTAVTLTALTIPAPPTNFFIQLDSVEFFANGVLQTEGSSTYGVNYTINPDGSVTIVPTEIWGTISPCQVTVFYQYCNTESRPPIT